MKNLDKINFLQELKKTQGWQIICETLDDNIKDAEDKMFDEKMIDVKEMNILKNKRNDRVQLKNLPDTLIKIYQKKEGIKKEFDVYE